MGNAKSRFGHGKRIRISSAHIPVSSNCLRRNVYLLAANLYLLPRKGYPQDALFAGNTVELRGINKVEFSPLNKVGGPGAFRSAAFQAASAPASAQRADLLLHRVKCYGGAPPGAPREHYKMVWAPVTAPDAAGSVC